MDRRRDFGMVRVSAVQTGLRGPITASEQTDEYALDGQGRWLLARSDVHQTYEGASIRTPIHPPRAARSPSRSIRPTSRPPH
jgi:hypothetical protein